MAVEKLQMQAVALRNMVVFPGMIVHFDLKRKESVQAIENAMLHNQEVFLIAQKEPGKDDPAKKDLYQVGCVAQIRQIAKLPGHLVRVLVEGRYIARLYDFHIDKDKGFWAVIAKKEIRPLKDEVMFQAMQRELRAQVMEFAKVFPKIGKSLAGQLGKDTGLVDMIYQIMINIPADYKAKQKVLEQLRLQAMYEEVMAFVSNEIEVSRVRTDLANGMKGRVDKNQKEYILREQLRYIKEELGEDSSSMEVREFREALNQLVAGKEVLDKIAKEIDRYESLSGSSTESSMERGYIETLLEMPWDKMTVDTPDLAKAKLILDRDHYGLEQVKERILEFLAVRNLTSKGESPIICLIGPPGTGKTSIARSIAQALDKKYVRISLGGVRDEAEIRGHRKTYVGAMPGRIAAGLRQAGVKNPLMLLDEIDKMSSDYKGDTASALLEVLDMEQNSRFRDHYVEIPIDLSEVFFIATANSASDIPRPLLDRMEIIEVSGYTANEKFHIAKEHLLGKQLAKNGLTKSVLQIGDDAIKDVILYYTREAGVRGLERKIGEICRKSARQTLETEQKRIRVTSKNLGKYLGKRKYSLNEANLEDEVGIVRGLAWTSVGGDTLEIEVNKMPGKGEVKLTGQMGDVMKESAMTGVSYIRSISDQYGIEQSVFREMDLHIHIPEGAVPKDGPSAGITMATAILSALTDIPVRADLAMTGEITLRGRVLPIGGLKEKILAAKQAGIKTVLVPTENEKDVEEISEEIRENIEIKYVKRMDEVLKVALVQ